MKMVFTTSEAAEACGVSYQTIYRRINEGILKSYRMPGSNQRRVKRRDLVDFIRQYGYPMRPQISEKARVLAILEDEAARKAAEQAFDGERWFEFYSPPGGLPSVHLVRGWMPDVLILDSREQGAAGSTVAEAILQEPALAECQILHLIGPRDPGLPAERRDREATLAAPVNADRLLESACGLLGWGAPVVDRDYIRRHAPHWDPGEDSRLQPGPGPIKSASGRVRGRTLQG